MGKYIDNFVNDLIEYNDFLTKNGDVPKINGPEAESRLSTWAAVTVSYFRNDKLSADQISNMMELCPHLYNRCVNNGHDLVQSLDKFKAWAFESLRYPQEVADDAEESHWHSWVCNIRAKSRAGKLTDEEIAVINSYCPLLIYSKKPTSEFRTWIINHRLNSRRAEANVNIDQFGLTEVQLEYFIRKDILNVWEVYEELKRCYDIKEYLEQDSIRECREYTDEENQVIQFITVCGGNYVTEGSLIYGIFKMIDPYISIGDIKLACAILGTDAIGLLMNKHIRIEELSKRVKKMLVNLYHDHKFKSVILVNRYYYEKTLEMIGNEYGKTRERIRQHEAAAIRMMGTDKAYLNGFEECIIGVVKEKSAAQGLNSISMLSVRAQNILRKNDINSMTDLHQYIKENGESSIGTLRNAGAKTVKEILDRYHSISPDELEGYCEVASIRDMEVSKAAVKKAIVPIYVKDTDEDLLTAAWLVHNARDFKYIEMEENEGD